ncbi:MAG TPA: aminoacyl-tRNA hydrolase [Anaerolineae bacterium]
MLLLDRLRRKPSTESAAPTTLIVGLGNPGREYAGSRHNIGWQVADRFVTGQGWRFSKKQNDALVAVGSIGPTRVMVAKPQTFMNLSGRAVQPLAKFYTVPLERMLVIYDDLDLPFGAIRLRMKGGAGGHNGMRSIIDRMGTDGFPRLRMGVGRPPGRMDAMAFLLRDFEPAEQAELPDILDRAVESVRTFITDGIAAAMNKHNIAANDTGSPGFGGNMGRG